MAEGKTIKVLIADNYYLFREGLKTTLKGLPDIEMMGEVQLLSEIPSKIENFLPDILLLELNLCNKSISDLIVEVRKISPTTKIMIVSDCACTIPIITSLKAGIAGFVRKNVSHHELIEAIHSIFEGKQYFSKDIINILLGSYSKPPTVPHALSQRELEILQYICKGTSNIQIAEILFISEKTVATHKRNIMRKAQINKTSDLIIWALRHSIVKNN